MATESINMAARLSLCSLPLEIKQTILCSLSDTYALKAAILSHSSIYSAFRDRPKSIIIRVLLNSIPQDLLPDAALVLDASTIEGWTWSNKAMSQDWTRKRVLTILNRHKNRAVPETISLNDAGSMLKFYHVVKTLTSDFISDAMPKNPALLQHPPSSREWNRVARSFYRFEVYRHLFRDRDNFDYGQLNERKKSSPDFRIGEQWEVYYKNFAVLELEQLATVGDYLFRRVAIPFNEIAEHDMGWGARGVRYGSYEAWELDIGGYIPRLLSVGLEHILKITTTPTYADRKRLMGRTLEQSYPFLPNVLQSIYRRKIDATPLKDYTAEQVEPLHGNPDAPEPDPGPANVWTWAHLPFDSDQFVWSVHCRELRSWGYVMWDDARLDHSDVYSLPFSPPPPPNREELRQRLDAVVASLLKRDRMYREGACSGWLVEGGESQVEWGDPPQSDEDDEEEEDRERNFFVSMYMDFLPSDELEEEFDTW